MLSDIRAEGEPLMGGSHNPHGHPSRGRASIGRQLVVFFVKASLDCCVSQIDEVCALQ